VENLLTMSRIQAGAVRLDLVPTDVADVAAAALALVDRRGREVEVDLTDAPLVVSDPDLLERVLSNLVDNACKWGPPDQPVTVDADAVGDLLTLRVADRGPGIPRDHRAAAFAPFQRLGDRAGVEGTGLGLAIAHGFVEAMGGSLEIDDTPGGGTTLLLTLPVATAPAPVPEAVTSW
jgi:two-component system sensor histidine kinase KdpD